MRKPALLLLTGNLGLGGTQCQVLALAKAAREEGWQVQLAVISEGDGFFLEQAARAELRVWTLEERRAGPEQAGVLDRLAWFLGWTWAPVLAQLMRREQVDVLQGMLDVPNLLAATAGTLAGTPVICAGLRSLAPHRYPHVPHKRWRREYSGVSSAFDRLIANSRAGAEDYSAWLSLPQGRIRVVPNGLDPAATPAPSGAELASAGQELGVSPDTPVLLFAGRLSAE
ncbi:secreted protein, partial [sediment metagenome]